MIRFSIELLVALVYFAWCVVLLLGIWAVFLSRELMGEAGELAAALALPPVKLLAAVLRGVNWLFGLKR